MAPLEKRCLYEVLGLQRDCTADEIRSTYRKLALQRHPDKLVKSGVSEAEATASFQELVNAYEVLSDPRERAWYDSHRSQILYTNSKSSSSSFIVPDLFSYFSNSVFSGYGDSGKGFYKVYAAVFDKIYASEVNFTRKLGLGLAVKEAPVMGNLESPYTQVTAFYGYWLGFATVMDFCWVDEYDTMMGPNRKVRRVMEEENKKVRKKARREYNETVRGLAEFVKKRDKRVIDMQMKRSEEMERKREEERERKRKLERERMEKARRYKEPEWANVDEEEIENGVFEDVEDDKKKGDGKELYCVVCGKKFKSEKQWKNHEQSKKHKEKVAELKEAFGDEEGEEEEEVELEEEEVLGDDVGLDGSGSVSADHGVDELQDQFESSFEIQDRKNGNNGDEAESSEEEVFDDIGNGGGSKGVDGSLGSVDDEACILETTGSGHENGRDSASMHQPTSKGKASETNAHGEDDSDETDSMAYNNWKKSTKTKSKGKPSEPKTRGEDDSDETDSMAYSNRKKSTRTKSKGKASATKAHVEDDSDEMDLMAYDNRMSRKSRRARREKGQKSSEEATRAGTAENNGGIEENSGHEDSLNLNEEESSHSVVENEINGKGDDQLKRSHKGSKQSVDKKGTPKSDTNTKSKNSLKGKKQKATSKTSGTVCDTCGEDFESRNKLYKHIGDTGHATLKSR